jgi:hypothetical protein
VSRQGQIDSVCFDVSSAFDIVPRSCVLCKLSSFGLSFFYVNWLHSCMTDRQTMVADSGTFISYPCTVKFGVPR